MSMTETYFTHMEWMADAADSCDAEGCSKDPVTVIDGERLCARHRDEHYVESGPPCPRCGSEEWIPYTDVRHSHHVCLECDLVVYAEEGLDE